METQITMLTKRLRELQKENEGLEREVEELREENMDLQMEIDCLRVENDKLKENFGQKDLLKMNRL